jgi:hypothetical protein
LGFITGLVSKEKSMLFERIIFRATRGNVYTRQAAVEEPVIDPVSGEKVDFGCISAEHFIIVVPYTHSCIYDTETIMNYCASCHHFISISLAQL